MSENESDLAIKKIESGNAYDRQAQLLAQSGKVWVPGKGIIDIPQEGGSNSSELNSRGNRNERIQSSIKEGFDAGAAGSINGNAAIKQAQSSDNSHTGGDGSGSSGHKHPDAASISAVARAQDASTMKAAVQVSFDLDPDERELKIGQNRLIQQTEQRLGITLNREDIQGMDISDINTAIKALATRTRPTESNPAVENFFQRSIPTQDFFDPVAVDPLPQ
ncbi:MAG: hypothetical protein AB7I41_12470 [Candidatus Sericytochromatia bacterium]